MHTAKEGSRATRTSNCMPIKFLYVLTTIQSQRRRQSVQPHQLRHQLAKTFVCQSRTRINPCCVSIANDLFSSRTTDDVGGKVTSFTGVPIPSSVGAGSELMIMAIEGDVVFTYCKETNGAASITGTTDLSSLSLATVLTKTPDRCWTMKGNSRRSSTGLMNYSVIEVVKLGQLSSLLRQQTVPILSNSTSASVESTSIKFYCWGSDISSLSSDIVVAMELSVSLDGCRFVGSKCRFFGRKYTITFESGLPSV